MKIQYVVLIPLLFYGIISCVPLKQFEDLKEKQSADRKELRMLQQQNEEYEVDNSELSAKVEKLKNQVEQLKADTVQLAKQNWELKNRNKELTEQYNSFLNSMPADNEGKASSDLLSHLQSLHEQLQKREDALLLSERELALKKQKLEELSSNLGLLEKELATRNKRLYELERILSEKDSLMNALKTMVADALTGFGSDELAVHIKNGKVYVSMEEKLLFGSGSYQVSVAGIQALTKIAKVLEQKSDINVLVEGHTDDVPYRSSVLLDNWDLSVKRATSVTRILLNNANIDESRVIAAGRGEFIPLDTAKTPEARRKNRRTEIILSPKLDQIFNILEAN
jgi:chemotaxis protein MotB